MHMFSCNTFVCRGCDQPWRPTAYRHAHAWSLQRQHLLARQRPEDFVQRRRGVRWIHDWLASLQQNKRLRCKLPAPHGVGGQRPRGEGTARALQHIWGRKAVLVSFQLHFTSWSLSQGFYLCHEIHCKHSASHYKFQRHFLVTTFWVICSLLKTQMGLWKCWCKQKWYLFVKSWQIDADELQKFSPIFAYFIPIFVKNM